MAADPLREEVERIRWFHTIQLREDLVTPGLEPDTPAKLPHMKLPADLSGRTVLDVGTWDGFFAFEAERRGAARVVATDHHAWNAEGWGDAGFRCAQRAFGSRVEPQDVDVLDHAPERVGTFDVVLFLGVLYHMRHPLLALERVASITGERLILRPPPVARGGRRGGGAGRPVAGPRAGGRGAPGPRPSSAGGGGGGGKNRNWWGPN